MPEVLPEDRTTPQCPPAARSDPSLERDKVELRPLLTTDGDATLVLPKSRQADEPLRENRSPRSAQSTLAMALKPGVTMHEYRIDGVLGDGGFGITYLATDVHLNANVAIKEYLPQDIVFRAADGVVSPMASEHLTRYKQGLESFLVEARTLASFRHPAIVRVARFFEAHRTAYMVLEVEKGEPLKTWWPQHKPLPEKTLVELLLPLLDGLAAVHKAGFLHRDIKPDNIQVRDSDGSLVLLDFGSAGQTAAVASHGLVVVTPGYAPLEQYGLGEQGPWTDLYALGATLYWAVAGKKPPDAETRKTDPKAYTRAVEAGRNVYGDPFLRAIDWALNTDPAKRPRSAAEFQRALCAEHPASLERFEAARRRAASRQNTQDSADESASAERRAPARPRWLSLLLLRDWPLSVNLALAMLLCAVLPMVLVAWSTLRGSVTALVDAESRFLQQVATQAAAQIADFVVEGRRLTHTLATDPAFSAYLQKPTEPARAALRDKLQRMALGGAGVQAVLLLDAAGTAQLGTEAGAQGTSHALRPYFVMAQGGQPYTSGLIAAKSAEASDATTSVYSSQPVRGHNGAVVGVMVLRVSGDAVATVLQRARVNPGLTPFMVDADGVLVQHPHADLRYRSLMPLPAVRQAEIRADQRFRRDPITSVGEAPLARALLATQAPGSLSHDSALSGSAVITGYAPVAGHDWVVAVSEDRGTVQAPLTLLHGKLLLGAIGVAMLMTGVAWLLARRIIKPARAVTHALQELQAGNFEDARVKAERGDEFGQLGRAFNALSDSLRQRDRHTP